MTGARLHSFFSQCGSTLPCQPSQLIRSQPLANAHRAALHVVESPSLLGHCRSWTTTTNPRRLIARGDGVRTPIEAAQVIAQNPENPWGYLYADLVYLSRKAEHDEERALADLQGAQSLGADPFVACSGIQKQQQQKQCSMRNSR